MFSAVKKAIDEWNPYSLLPYAPEDEFDIESKMIASRITKDSSELEIAGIVSDVFSQLFEPEYFQVDSCMEVARAIKSSIDECIHR